MNPNSLNTITRKFIVMLLAIAAMSPGLAAAQIFDGRLAYDYCDTAEHPQEPFWGTCLGGWAIAAGLFRPSLSPDGTRVAFSGLFVLNLNDWSLASVHDGGSSPAWSPDGTKLAFAMNELYVMNGDGSNVVQLTTNVGFRGEPAWSRDGGTIAFDCEVETGNLDICAINVDGTSFRRLTYALAWDSGADYSPDGSSIAFATEQFGPGAQIAVMNLNGTGVSPLGAGVNGTQPKWSLGGTDLAYASPWGEICQENGECTFYNAIAFTSRDGTGQGWIGLGDHPTWAPSLRPIAWFVLQACNGLDCPFDGSGSASGISPIVSYSWDFGDGTNSSGITVNHTYPTPGTYRVTLKVTDGSGATAIQSRDLHVDGNVWPIARFTYACSGGRCTFDASSSSDADGTIIDYFWTLGDPEWGPSASGRTVTQLYLFTDPPHPFTVTLLVRDDHGAWGSQQQVVDLSSFPNAPPVVSLAVSCTALTCTFNASASDPDGVVTWGKWFFGDGTSSGSDSSHTYAAAGTYEVTLVVKDNMGATTVATRTVTVAGEPPSPPMHIGDLDGTQTNQQNTWTALVTIRVHDMTHGPVANATVSGSWDSGGTSSCTTDDLGRCFVTKSTIPKSTKNVTFTIINVTKPVSTFSSVANHDPDGDSSGTSIKVTNR